MNFRQDEIQHFLLQYQLHFAAHLQSVEGGVFENSEKRVGQEISLG